MSRKYSLLFIILLASSVYGLLQIKYQVQEMREEVSELTRQIVQENETMHVLRAEWAYLNKPERLKKLSEKYLQLSSARSDQLYSVEELKVADIINQDPEENIALRTANKNLHLITLSKKVKWKYKDKNTHEELLKAKSQLVSNLGR